MPKFDALAFFGQGIPSAMQAGVGTYQGLRQQQSDAQFQKDYMSMLQDNEAKNRKQMDMFTALYGKQLGMKIVPDGNGGYTFEDMAAAPPPSAFTAPAGTPEGFGSWSPKRTATPGNPAGIGNPYTPPEDTYINPESIWNQTIRERK